jgi:hypothetical protein
MSVKQIVDILQNSQLDRETKLQIIDILSAAHDQKMIDDLIDLLAAWNEVDQAEQKDFLEKLENINRSFELRQQTIDAVALRAENQILNDMETAQKVEALKKQLSS